MGPVQDYKQIYTGIIHESCGSTSSLEMVEVVEGAEGPVISHESVQDQVAGEIGVMRELRCLKVPTHQMSGHRPWWTPPA